MAEAVFSVGAVGVYESSAKKKSCRIRWRAGEGQISLTVNDLPTAQGIALEIYKDLSAGIYNSRDYYDPKKAVEKARFNERYKHLDHLWNEWEKLEH